jgi:hypothetical protein
MYARHLRFTRSAQLAAAALVVVASSLAAQGGGAGGFVGGARGSGGSVVAREHATIPVQTVRSLVAAHHADVANGTSEDNILTLMIDSNGNYVGSATSKANVVARVAPSGENVAAATASGARGAGGGGGAVITAAPAGAVARGAGGGFATATASGEPGKLNFVGIGTVDASLVQDVFWTNYEAGEISPNALRVRFVILKNGVPK